MALAEVDSGEGSEIPILDPTADAAVAALIRERREFEELASAGLEPSSRVMLLGPPGVGKSMTARYIAASLHLPLVTVDLAAVVSSYLGKTGHNLRRVLDYGRRTECVFLADEFDALAKRRDDESDVGELKRIVNVLLMELDRWPASTLFIAASNHPDLLDPAVERRFDSVIRLGLADRPTRARLFSSAALAVGTMLSQDAAELCALATEGLSGSDVRRMVEAAMRESVLTKRAAVDALVSRAIASLSSRGLQARDERALFAVLATRELGLSMRRVADILRVTHPTVAALIASYDPSRLASGAQPVG